MDRIDWRQIPRERRSQYADRSDDLRLLESLMAHADKLDDDHYGAFGMMRDLVRDDQFVIDDRCRRWAEQTAEALGIRFTPREMDR